VVAGRGLPEGGVSGVERAARSRGRDPTAIVEREARCVVELAFLATRLVDPAPFGFAARRGAAFVRGIASFGRGELVWAARTTATDSPPTF
jgi:hypothetical protein